MAANRARFPRILHAPVDIGGHASGLAAAQRLLGLDAVCVSLYPTPQSDGRAEEPVPAGAGIMTRELARWALFWRALRHYDIIHLYFGESLLMPRRHPDLRSGRAPTPAEIARRCYARAIWGKDLPVLKGLGKRLVFSFLGDDVRLQDFTAKSYDISIARYADATYYPPRSDCWKRRIIDLAERYAEVIFAYNPDLLHVLPRGSRLLPYSHLFPDKIVAGKRAAAPGVIRIAHAPTHFSAKGTPFVLDAIATLRERNVEFEFDLIQGVSHGEAMRRIGEADLFIDQVLAGWYGGAAVEAMMLGVPVVAYIRPDDLGGVSADMARELPIIRSTPDTLVAVLTDAIGKGESRLCQQGQIGRVFARKYHDPVRVARQVSEALGLPA